MKPLFDCMNRDRRHGRRCGGGMEIVSSRMRILLSIAGDWLRPCCPERAGVLRKWMFMN